MREQVNSILQTGDATFNTKDTGALMLHLAKRVIDDLRGDSPITPMERNNLNRFMEAQNPVQIDKYCIVILEEFGYAEYGINGIAKHMGEYIKRFLPHTKETLKQMTTREEMEFTDMIMAEYNVEINTGK
jgi:hypothetical protein